MKLDWASLATACEALGIEKLSDQDLDFLKEYIRAIRPIADAITYIEGMRCFGSYLPTLFAARLKLRELYLDDQLIYCQPLVCALSNGFDRRFADVMNLGSVYQEGSPKAVPLYLAMISNPAFKLSYIPQYWFDANPNTITQIKSMMLNAMRMGLKPSQNETHAENDAAEPQPQSTAELNSSGNFQIIFFM